MNDQQKQIYCGFGVYYDAENCVPMEKTASGDLVDTVSPSDMIKLAFINEGMDDYKKSMNKGGIKR